MLLANTQLLVAILALLIASLRLSHESPRSDHRTTSRTAVAAASACLPADPDAGFLSLQLFDSDRKRARDRDGADSTSSGNS